MPQWFSVTVLWSWAGRRAAKVFGGQELYDALDKQRVDLFGFNAEIWNECDSRRAAVE